MEFLPSKKLSHADRLSRLTPRFCKPLEDAVIVAIRAENEINNIYNTVRELPITLEEIRINFEKDNCIMKIKKQLRFKGKNTTGNNAFSLCNNVLMYVERIVIPASLQRHMLKEFHIEYPGIFRMKSLMRCYTYWPKMDQDIKNLVKSCRG